MEYTIRPIEERDITTVYTQLLELVEYEGIADDFRLTLDRMKKELFSPNADWYCIVAIQPPEEILGFCLYSIANTNRAFNLTPLLHIDNIFVKPEYRAHGIGKALLQELACIAKARSIERIELWCIKDNDSGNAFYQRLGAKKFDFLDVYRLDVPSLLS